MLRAIAVCALLVATARADDGVSGFVAYGAGTLTGQVVDAHGAPLANVVVHAVSRTGGERTATTDKAGTYKIVLAGAPGEASMVFVTDHPGARVGGETAVTVAAGSDAEAIAVRAMVPPAVMPKPHDDPAHILDYSDLAIDKDAWVRAWLLLDIDATGTVRHVKFLKRAAYDLDPIAVRAAFKLKFDPARDRANHPIPAALVWSFEWPSYYWMQAGGYALDTLPPAIAFVTCQKPDEHRTERRDCSGPDVTHGLTESWIAPRRATK